MLRASHQGGRLITRRSESFYLMKTSSRTGDYRLMPTRVATGDMEWPQDEHSHPQLLPLLGIEHHYALLGFVGPGPEWKIERFRHEFSPVMRRGKKE